MMRRCASLLVAAGCGAALGAPAVAAVAALHDEGAAAIVQASAVAVVATRAEAAAAEVPAGFCAVGSDSEDTAYLASGGVEVLAPHPMDKKAAHRAAPPPTRQQAAKPLSFLPARG